MQELLTRKEKLAYGVGDIANGLAISAASFWLLIYLTDVAGLSPVLAGAALMIGRIWDAITDPIMGWITDRTNTRWGKRRPYLLFGSFAFALAFFGVWCIPAFDNQTYLFMYVTAVLVVFNTCFTVVFVPYTSLTAAMTSDYNERTSLTGYRMTCSQIAFLLGAALPSAIVLHSVSPAGQEFFTNLGIQEFFGSWAGTRRQGYMISAGLFSIVIIASLLVTFLGVREKVEENTSTSGSAKSSNPLEYIKLLFHVFLESQPYRYAVMIILLSNCAATFIGVNLPYYIQYVLELTSIQTKIISLLFCSAILAVPVWVLIARKFGKAESYRNAMLAYVFGVLMLFFIPTGGATQILALAVFNGFFHAAALMLPWAIIPDIVEYDQLKTGQRREGLFYGGTSFAYKLATALAIFLSGCLLDFVGYMPNMEQSSQTLLGIRLIITFASIAMLLGGILFAMKYPLNRARHSEILDELAAKKLKAL